MSEQDARLKKTFEILIKWNARELKDLNGAFYKLWNLWEDYGLKEAWQQEMRLRELKRKFIIKEISSHNHY